MGARVLITDVEDLEDDPTGQCFWCGGECPGGESVCSDAYCQRWDAKDRQGLVP